MAKEVFQLLRNGQLIFLLLFPPTVQLFVYGVSLNPEVRNLSLGVVDYAQSRASRDVVSAFSTAGVFHVASVPLSGAALAQAVRSGRIAVGLIIPPEFDRDIGLGGSGHVQTFVDGVNAYTGAIATGDIVQVAQRYDARFEAAATPLTAPVFSFIYNPGLVSSWFFLPGLIGAILIFTSTLAAAVATIGEKHTGTLEQLMMTPAAAWEIIIAKIVPLFLLIMMSVTASILVARIVFGLPARGSMPLFFAFSAVFILTGIALGVMLGTFAKSKHQVILTTFFVNLPMVMLSGALAPLESMPPFFQYASFFLNPVRHYVMISRDILMKGAGIDVFWLHALVLSTMAIAALAISVVRYREQLS